jgi:transcription-repair coupling factor (superfamily II helicase)
VELYQQMLEDAVKALQSGSNTDEDVADDWSPLINLGMSVLIPEGYVEDLGVRLGLYRRLADLDTEQEREAFAAELIDRFGPLPAETQQLLDVTAVKVTCKSLGISKLDAGPKGVVVTFRDDTKVDPAQLMMLVRSRPGKMKLRPDSKLVVMGISADPKNRMTAIKGLMRELAATASALA